MTQKIHYLLLLFIILVSLISIQAQNRVDIYGQIIVEGTNLEDITVYNLNSKQGTVSGADGKFIIKATQNDSLQFSAIQYQNFTIPIEPSIMETRQLRVVLIKEITQLDEIVISNRKVTGNFKTDVNTSKAFIPKLTTKYFSLDETKQDAIDNRQYAVGNVKLASVTDQNRPLVNGLNVINVVDQLLLPLFRAEVKNKKGLGVPEVPLDTVKYYFGSEFLNENFNIPKHRIEEFIRYVEAEDFDFTLLNYGKELQFLEVLNTKSKQFLKQ